MKERGSLRALFFLSKDAEKTRCVMGNLPEYFGGVFYVEIRRVYNIRRYS